MTRSALLLVFVAAATPALAVESWVVREGERGDTRGVWQVVSDGNRLTGNGSSAGSDGRPVTFGLSGEMKGRGYLIHRVRASDGSECVYRGEPVDDYSNHDLIARGTVICNGRVAPFSASRK